MKKWTRLFFLIFCVMFWAMNSGQAGAADKKKEDMASELKEKTFFVVEHARKNKSQQDYHAFFKKDGTLAIKFTPRHSKSGKWKMDDKGNLCITRTVHKPKTSLQETKCGKFVKKNDSVFYWYDDKSRHRATFTLKGKGNRLP